AAGTRRPVPPGRANPRYRRSSSSTLLRVALELQVLMVQTMTELLTLRLQVEAVLQIRRYLDRHLLDAGQPVGLGPFHLARIVREQSDGGQAKIGQDLVADAVVTGVGGEAECEVGLDRVHPLLLELVGPQLVQQADASTLLRHVEQHSLLLGPDQRQRLFELLAAVAAKRVEDVAGEAFGMDADEHVPSTLD